MRNLGRWSAAALALTPPTEDVVAGLLAALARPLEPTTRRAWLEVRSGSWTCCRAWPLWACSPACSCRTESRSMRWPRVLVRRA